MYQTLTTSPAGTLGSSDYDRVGGYVTVNSVVDDLCDRVLGDLSLAPFFRGAHTASIHTHQMALVTHLLGGPVTPSLQEVRGAYGGAPVPPVVFGAVAEHLVSALRRAAVPQDVVLRAVMALVQVERSVIARRR